MWCSASFLAYNLSSIHTVLTSSHILCFSFSPQTLYSPLLFHFRLGSCCSLAYSKCHLPHSQLVRYIPQFYFRCTHALSPSSSSSFSICLKCSIHLSRIPVSSPISAPSIPLIRFTSRALFPLFTTL